jgi:hypothetical protein
MDTFSPGIATDWGDEQNLQPVSFYMTFEQRQIV